jgi:cholesterol oxidase
VHGSAALYVLDGAALCTSVGVNPSATIAAVAEHHIQEFVRLHAPERPNAAGLAAYQSDRHAAARFADQARASGWHLEPPQPPTVAFAAEPLGLSFDETMRGYYEPGLKGPATDEEFRERETRGRPDYPLSVSLTVTAQNLGVFFEDMTHAMDVSGTIDVRLPGSPAVKPYPVTGRLELMVPRYKPHGVNAADRERLAAQEFALRGQAGFEALSASELAGLDAWRDTSSLFVRLFAVPDPPDLKAVPDPGCLRGAGVIHVDVNDFTFDQLGSMKVTGTDDPARIAFAITKFSAFFFGALQRIYLPGIGKAAETFFGGLVR